MISVIFILSIVWLGFVIDEASENPKGDFLLRLAAAIILGSFWSAWLVYLLAWLTSGLHLWTLVDATIFILLFNAYAWRKRGRNFAWFTSLLVFDRGFWRGYLAFPALITLFFVTGFWINHDGDIRYHGNFTDLGFHMSTASAFLQQSAFPPLNPQSAAAKLSYHFMADFFAAILCRGGLPLFYSLKVPMVLFAFSLGSLICLFYHRLLRQRIAAVCACILFLFGHIGLFNFLYSLAGYPVGTDPLKLSSWTSIEDHLTFPYFNFLNVLVDFFEPQLPFLFGFPFALLLLLLLFRKFSEAESFNRRSFLLLGSVALLPLFHLHSFLVLGPLTGLVIFLECRGFIAARLGRAAPPGPFPYGQVSIRLLALLLAGLAVGLQFAFILSQKKAVGFSAFDVGNRLAHLSEIPDFLHARRLWYWVRAAGMPFVLGLAGFFLAPTFQLRAKDPGRRANLALLAAFTVTTGYFLLINFYRFTPNWGDSNKFFLYWDLFLCLYAGRLLSRLWTSSPRLKAVAVTLLLLGSILPFGIEWSLRLRRGPSTLFTACDQKAADWIRANTPGDAVFLSANSYNHLVPALAGRRVVDGSYTQQTGFSDGSIEQLVSRAYREANPGIIKAVKVTHLIVSPEEKSRYYLNRTALARWHKLVYDDTCRGQRYSIYEVRDVSPEQVEAERQKGALNGFVWLSEQEPAFVQQFGNLQYDESFDMTPIRLNGKTYSSGLGTHAPSEIRFDLNERYTLFESDVGLDDSQRGTAGSVVFRVNVDGKTVFTSQVLKGGSPHETVAIDLTGARTLTLFVDEAGDGNHNDHANWAEPKLTRKR